MKVLSTQVTVELYNAIKEEAASFGLNVSNYLDIVLTNRPDPTTFAAELKKRKKLCDKRKLERIEQIKEMHRRKKEEKEQGTEE